MYRVEHRTFHDVPRVYQRFPLEGPNVPRLGPGISRVTKAGTARVRDRRMRSRTKRLRVKAEHRKNEGPADLYRHRRRHCHRSRPPLLARRSPRASGVQHRILVSIDPFHLPCYATDRVRTRTCEADSAHPARISARKHHESMFGSSRRLTSLRECHRSFTRRTFFSSATGPRWLRN